MKLAKFFLLLLAASCTGSGPGIAARKPISACALMPIDQVESATGRRYEQGQEQIQAAGAELAAVSTCTYIQKGADLSSDVSLIVRTHLESGNDPETYDLFKENTLKQLGPDSLVDVPNIGDGAGWNEKLNKLTFFRGENMYELTVNGVEKSLDSAKQIAASILTRLKE